MLRRTEATALTVLVVVFVLSRVLFFATGVRFDVGQPLDHHVQLLETDLLKNDLLRSVWYLHIQPPLYNLYVGIVLKLFPGHEVTVFHATHLAAGLVLSLSLYLLMVRLGVSVLLGLVITTLFVVSPACVLYENWLCYSYPVAALLCVAALFLWRFLEEGRAVDGLVFFGFLAVVVLTRSVFHIVWFAGAFTVVLVYRRAEWRRVVAVACVPFALALSPFVKNLCVFGVFASSSWQGMSFSKITTFQLSREEREGLVAEGVLSDLALARPFSGQALRTLEDSAGAGIPVLDRVRKDSGCLNFNHASMVGVSERYMADALHALAARPEAYLRGVRRAYTVYARPTTDYKYLSEANLKHLGTLTRFYEAVFYGQFADGVHGRYWEAGGAAYFLIVGLPLLVVCGLVAAWRGLSRRIGGQPFGVAVLFLCGTILYVTLVVNDIEVGENNRFRFMIDPFNLVLLGVLLDRAGRRWLFRNQRASGGRARSIVGPTDSDPGM